MKLNNVLRTACDLAPDGLLKYIYESRQRFEQLGVVFAPSVACLPYYTADLAPTFFFCRTECLLRKGFMTRLMVCEQISEQILICVIDNDVLVIHDYSVQYVDSALSTHFVFQYIIFWVKYTQGQYPFTNLFR